MPQAPEAEVRIDTFRGLYLSNDPFSMPPGAMVDQLNMTLVEAGAATSRRGMQPVEFEE